MNRGFRPLCQALMPADHVRKGAKPSARPIIARGIGHAIGHSADHIKR
jgi:hypothetical protein